MARVTWMAMTATMTHCVVRSRAASPPRQGPAGAAGARSLAALMVDASDAVLTAALDTAGYHSFPSGESALLDVPEIRRLSQGCCVPAPWPGLAGRLVQS